MTEIATTEHVDIEILPPARPIAADAVPYTHLTLPTTPSV